MRRNQVTLQPDQIDTLKTNPELVPNKSELIVEPHEIYAIGKVNFL